MLRVSRSKPAVDRRFCNYSIDKSVPASVKILRIGASSFVLSILPRLMAACKRVAQIWTQSRLSSAKIKGFNGAPSSGSLVEKLQYRRISQLVSSNGKRAFLVDTLALVRSLEAQGVPSKQAEAITSAITEVLNDSLENVSHSFVSKAEMQKTQMLQESNLSKFKSEVQSSQGQLSSPT